MSGIGYTPILIYGSGTPGNTPSAGNLTSNSDGAELAINYADGKLFYKDSGGVVQVIATKGAGTIGGSNTQVQYNSSGALAGSANLTFNGTTLTAAGLAGPLNGTVGATTPNTGAFTTLTASGLFTSTKTGQAFLAQSSTTGASWLELANTGGRLYFGVDNSSGNGFGSGGTAYAVGIYSVNNTPVNIGVNGATVTSTSSTGLAVTGTLSSTDTITSSASTTDLVGLSVINTNNSVGTITSSAIRLGITNSAGASYVRLMAQEASADDYPVLRVGVQNAVTTTPTTVATFSSTGLAVTGTLSATASGYGLALVRSDDTQQGIRFKSAGGENYINSRNEGSATRLPIIFESTNNSSTVEWMRLDSSGNLGIGTTTPASFGALCTRRGISVAGVTGSVSASFSDGANDTLYVSQDSGLSRLTFATLTFNTGTTERARINTTGLAVTGVTSSTYSFESTGAVQANAANKATLSLESASTGRLCVFGADTSTFGTLNLAVAKSNGGPTTVGSITSTGLAVTGIINTGTATTSGANTNDICLPNNRALRGANTTNAASRTLAYVDTGNFAAYGDASLNGVKITGNTEVTGTGGGSYVGQFTNSNSTSYGLYVAAGGGGSRQIAYFADYAGAVTMNVQSGSVSVTGALSCTGALSKGSGSFRITHPLPQLSETHQLVHSFIEGPKADLIYRGKVSLVNGAASVNIDSSAGMTEGTFVVLCRDVQCFTTNESDWTPVRGFVSGNVLTIEAQDNTSAASVSWMVIGERQDQHMYDTDWTDDDGHVIVEPLKPVVENQEQADAQV